MHSPLHNQDNDVMAESLSGNLCAHQVSISCGSTVSLISVREPSRIDHQSTYPTLNENIHIHTLIQVMLQILWKILWVPAAAVGEIIPRRHCEEHPSAMLLRIKIEESARPCAVMARGFRAEDLDML